MLPVWFVTVFVILMVVLVAAVSVLFYFVFKPDNNTPLPTGPQGPSGDQGEIGFPGVRGPQGLADVGPQGIPGVDSNASSQIVRTKCFFELSDNATFLVFPDEKQVFTFEQRVNKTITISAMQIECFIDTAEAKNFTLRVVTSSEQAENTLITCQGYAQMTSINVPILLTTATRIDQNTIALVYECSTTLYSGGVLPKCDCFFILSYQAV